MVVLCPLLLHHLISVNLSIHLISLPVFLSSLPSSLTPPAQKGLLHLSPDVYQEMEASRKQGGSARALAAAMATPSTTYHPKTWGPALPRCPQDTLRTTAAHPLHPARLLPWPGSCCSTVSRPRADASLCPWRGRTLPCPAASRCSLHSSWTTWLASRASRWEATSRVVTLDPEKVSKIYTVNGNSDIFISFGNLSYWS